MTLRIGYWIQRKSKRRLKIWIKQMSKPPLPYRYKREPLNDDEVDELTNVCEAFQDRFVLWTFVDATSV
jgi:hypothetical protein